MLPSEPLWPFFYITIENGMAIEIVDLPIDSMVIFHSFLYVYQRI